METKAESRAQSESSGTPRYPHAVQLCVLFCFFFSPPAGPKHWRFAKSPSEKQTNSAAILCLPALGKSE